MRLDAIPWFPADAVLHLQGTVASLSGAFVVTGFSGGVLDCGVNTLLVWIWYGRDMHLFTAARMLTL